MRRILVFITFLSLNLNGQSLSPDALKPDFSHQYYYWQQDGYYFIDTSFNSLNWYHAWNTAEQDDFGQLVMMNMGGARNNLLLPSNEGLTQYQSFGPFSDYFTNPKRIRYYQVRSPLTAARYINGYDRGQLFRIYHTQNISKNWNFAVNYRRLNSLSFYINDQNKQSSFTLSTHYKSKKGTYEAFGYFATESLQLQENGGLSADSLFTQNLETTRTLMLTNFDRDRRALYNREYFIDHKIDFWKVFSKKKRKAVVETLDSLYLQMDSLQIDSLNRDSLHIDPIVRDSLQALAQDEEEETQSRRSILLGHTGRYNRRAQGYRGRTTNFYDRYLFDTDGDYRDSSRYASLYNELYLQTIIGDTSRFDLKAGAFHQFLQYGNSYFNTTNQHLGLTANLNGNYRQYFNLKAEGSYILGGPFANNFDLKARLKGRFYKSLGAFATYHIQNKHPEMMRQVYISNNYLWNINPGAILRNELTIGMQWGRNNFLRLRTFSAADWVYFGADHLPQVATDIVAYQSIDLRQNFKFWDWIYQDNEVRYQIALSGAEFMPLPELVNRHSLYFRFPLFGNALKVLVGAEASYFSSFNSPSYSPATGQMILANEYPIGDYMMIDAFAQFKVSKAVIFIKMQNLTQGFTPYDYWAAPHYPLNDRVFRFGVNWRFFN